VRKMKGTERRSPARRGATSTARHASSTTRKETILGGGGWKKLSRGLGARIRSSCAIFAPISRLDIMRADKFDR